MEEDKLGVGDVNAAIRAAKKSARPVKIGEPERRASAKEKRTKKGGKGKAAANTGQGIFVKDLGQREGVRALKGDAIGRVGKRSRK